MAFTEVENDFDDKLKLTKTYNDNDYISAMENIYAMQAEAEKNNCQKITLDEINKEIEDYRNGR
jgi:hypothetical protein